MTKYVKVAVPDDWDGSTIGDYPIWEPQYTPVLNHGFVGPVDFYGDDEGIVNAARVSYGKGTQKKRSDRGLLRYLMRHLHTTPFEMVDFKFHVKAPIFVFRQWHRHRTFSINEYSARYSVLDAEMYEPEREDMAPNSVDNKQGRDDNLLTEEEYTAVMAVVTECFETTYQGYMHLLGPHPDSGQLAPPTDGVKSRLQWCQDAAVAAVREARRRAKEDEQPDPYPNEGDLENAINEYMVQNGVAALTNDFPGIARELARMVLPVATYSQMYWKGNLHNLFHFLNLRCDPHAQKEIRVYADAILDLIEPIVPWSVQAFRDYLLHGARLSRMEIEVLQDIIQRSGDRAGIAERLSAIGASDREIKEFLTRFA